MSSADPGPSGDKLHAHYLELCSKISGTTRDEGNDVTSSPPSDLSSLTEGSQESPNALQRIVALVPSSQEPQGTSSEQLQDTQETEASDEETLLENVPSVIYFSPVEIIQKIICSLTESLNETALQETIRVDLASSMELELRALMLHTDNIDNAIDFAKLGGFDILEPLLNVPDLTVKAKTLELIADLVQNNVYCQKELVEIGLLPKLVEILGTESDDIVCIKALYSVSCLCRQYPPAADYFLRLDGLSKLVGALQKPVKRLRIKAAFFLTHLMHQYDEVKGILFNMGIVELLAYLIQEDFTPSHEYLLGCLASVVCSHFPAQIECMRPELRLQESCLSLMCTVQKHFPECYEVRDHLKRLWVHCGPKAVASDEQKRAFDELDR